MRQKTKQRLWLDFVLPVRCAFGAITCNVKYEQSTSELCRKRQRSRVIERNSNGNLAPAVRLPTSSSLRLLVSAIEAAEELVPN